MCVMYSSEWSCVFDAWVCVGGVCLLLSLEVEEFHVGEMRCPVCCFGCGNEEIVFECKCVDEGGEWTKVLFDVFLPQ